ncbi:MAG: PSD1 and planctomycete cytochrome C domain-containing protein [Planctomycetaceae bacterium]
MDRPKAVINMKWSGGMRLFRCLAMVGLILAGTISRAEETFSPEQIEFFESHVRPLLVEHCQKCHGPDKEQAGLRLDSRTAALTGGENGPAIAPKHPEMSLLIKAVRYDGDTQMPPDGKLSDEQIATLEKWVAMGAPWPTSKSLPDAEKLARQQSHWAFQPVKSVEPPSVREKDWCRTPVDQFILAQLESQQLAHSPEADRRTLIRRVTYDLTGLPPTPEEVDAFVNDPSSDAYGQLVERLLSSPQYGEHWARHWLDVARYSDTKGYVYAREERFWVHAPTYRDWVVKALNDDMPYNRFLTLQIAADQVAPDDRENQAAMGFLTLGRRFLGVTHDIYDDRIDVVTRGTMALTASCARCHDHKYDPIPTADYYSLYGVFMNSFEELIPATTKPATNDAEVAFTKELTEKSNKQSELFAKKRIESADRIRGRITDYLVAQTEISKHPQEGFDVIIAATDLVPAVVWRWESYIATEIERKNPVWIPWQRYAAIPEGEFAAKAGEVTQSLTMNGGASINPRVAALFQTPPASMREVAERYGKLLTEINTSWTTQVESALKLGSPLPNQLADSSAEALRQVLYNPASPCLIFDESIVSTELYYDSGSVDELWKAHNEIDRMLINNPTAPPYTVVLKDRSVIRPNRILRRGNPANKIGFVDRHFLSLIDGPSPKPFTHGSGRRELAEAIVDPSNPLTARVWVNRIWQHHFGIGLVRTPSDFGIRAENPSHPELLDWLATQLISSGWSTKAIHRLIVMSSTYQQRSTGPTDPAAHHRAEQIDPDNRWLWRMNVHRLSWEEFRDTLLADAGQLDRRIGGRATDLFAGQGTANHRRTMYGIVDRQFLPSVLRMFDFANPDLSIPARSETTVPQQALFSLNHPMMADKSRALVAHAKLNEVDDESEKVRRLFRATFQREPTSSEREAAISFVHTRVEPPPSLPSEESKAWSYGYGEFDDATKKLKSFTPLPFFNGNAWQGSATWPDPTLGWVQVTARGGHPGNDLAHAGIRRWTAPRAGTYSVKSKVAHEVAEGDGIRCRIISSRSGVLAEALVHNRAETMDIASITLEAGDTLDFVVDIHGGLNSDQHLWSPVVTEQAKPDLAWNAERDFTGPAPVLLTEWEQLAQVLLLSNELMFVD